MEYSKQGPSFGSSGWDMRYYQADENWNPIINPDLTLDYGRIPMPDQYWTVQSGIQKEPVFRPGVERVTIDGVNYVVQRRILTDPSLIDDTNLYGLIPNAPTPSNPGAYSGNWNPGGYTNNRLIYLANVTDWFDGDDDMEGEYFGYDGPCPPWNDSIVHHYVFTLYALGVERCPVEGRFGGPEVLKAIEGHVLGVAKLTGAYSLNPAVKV